VWWKRILSWLRHEPDSTIAIIVAVIVITLSVLFSLGHTTLPWALAGMTAAYVALLVGNVRDRLNSRSRDEVIRGLERAVGEQTRAVRELSDVVRHLSEPVVYPTQHIPYARLREYIARHKVRDAVFLQYSGQACAEVIEAVLLKKGARATVYLQDEGTARDIGSKFQENRIATSISNLRKWQRKYDGISELTVYQCTMPMTVRAIMIDDRLLCMGPYTYEPEADEKHPGDTVEVSGHDVATVIAHRGTGNFDALRQTFDSLVRKYELVARRIEP